MKIIRGLKLTVAAAIVLAGGLLTYLAPAASAAAPGCGPAHRVSGVHSLRYVAWHQTHGDVAYLLTATLRCNGGTRYPAFLQFYLNNGDLTVPLYKGTRLWFKAPGIGEPLARVQP
jgi:hypothetical protein